MSFGDEMGTRVDTDVQDLNRDLLEYSTGRYHINVFHVMRTGSAASHVRQLPSLGPCKRPSVVVLSP